MEENVEENVAVGQRTQIQKSGANFFFKTISIKIILSHHILDALLHMCSGFAETPYSLH